MQVFAETMDRGRDEGEDILYDMINDGYDEGSQFLNESGEGMEDLDRRDSSAEGMEDLDRRDGSGEGMEGEDDGSGVGTLTTKSGEVY